MNGEAEFDDVGADGDYPDEGEYGDEGGEGGEGGEGNELFEALASNPNFENIRQRITQDPAFYQQFMQQLQQQQPNLYAAIQNNPAGFMNLVLGGNANIGLSGGAAAPAHAHAHAPAEAMEADEGGLRVSQEEMEAIDRLANLGFPRSKAAEAYISCDKNEELAANYLFENQFEDEPVQQQ